MPRKVLIWIVATYRLLFKAWLGSECRFEPTCSAYALEALQKHGAASGTYLTLARLARCQPWCSGGCDPVPIQTPRLFTRLWATPSEKKS